MRGRRAMLALTAYLAILLVVALSVYAIAVSSQPADPSQTGESVGQALFVTLSILQAALVIILAPAFTANAISQEREQKTFDMLAVTLVEPASIVVGKLAASLAYLAMCLVASLPVMSLAFLFGGVEPSALVEVFAIEMLFALAFGALGLFFSSFVRRTLWSTVFSYVVIFVVVAIFPIMDAAVNALGSLENSEFQPLLTYLNPFPLILSAISPEFAQGMREQAFVPFTTVTPIVYVILAAGLLVAAVHFVGPRKVKQRL
jgi:ABC-type transport system involved in multi-copper enzyme maturation permease subunit